MTSKEAKEKYGKSYYLTVGVLKKILEDYPDDALVVSQRVEDFYYEQNGWETIKKPDPIYPESNNEYTPIWGAVHYGDEQKEKNCLFLDLHY